MLLALLVLATLLPLIRPAAANSVLSHVPGLALFDSARGEWHLFYGNRTVDRFYYGIPGDTPLLGDWDCDGVDSVGLYRESTGFVYLRNSNDFGTGSIEFFYGIPGDIPITGDWDGDGCDTLGVYRNGRVLLSNRLGTHAADVAFFFGVTGDRPFAGDFDSSGFDSVGLYRPNSGFAYLTNSIAQDVAPTDAAFFYGIPGDRIIASDWDSDGDDTVGIFRPAGAMFFLSNENIHGEADVVVPFGEAGWVPVGGDLGPSPCDPAYPGVCIPPPPPSLRCDDLTEYDFAVRSPDPHLLDPDRNGIGCESSSTRRFGDGVHLIGVDVSPGTFRAALPAPSCSWERRSGFTTSAGDLVSTMSSTAPQLVTIDPTDAVFVTQGCGDWTSDLRPITAATGDDFGSGMFIVGEEVASGTWRSEAHGGSCQWSRLADFGGTSAGTIAERTTSVRQLVTISPADVGFSSEGCGNWTADLRPITASPTTPFGDGIYLVNTDIAPGVWRSAGDFTGLCSWQLLGGFSGEETDIIGIGEGDPFAAISESAVGFSTEGCGTWEKIDGP